MNPTLDTLSKRFAEQAGADAAAKKQALAFYWDAVAELAANDAADVPVAQIEQALQTLGYTPADMKADISKVCRIIKQRGPADPGEVLQRARLAVTGFPFDGPGHGQRQMYECDVLEAELVRRGMPMMLRPPAPEPEPKADRPASQPQKFRYYSQRAFVYDCTATGRGGRQIVAGEVFESPYSLNLPWVMRVGNDVPLGVAKEVGQDERHWLSNPPITPEEERRRKDIALIDAIWATPLRWEPSPRTSQ